MRIGFGYDAHRFGTAPATAIMLGCVAVPFDRVVEAHSDGDVIAHALCDALLGAASLGDIGAHFPDSDPTWAGAAGAVLLAASYARVRAAGFELGNTDITLMAQRPRVASHVTAMRTALAAALDVAVNCISVKATTTEGMGFIGREEGIAAHAVVLIR